MPTTNNYRQQQQQPTTTATTTHVFTLALHKMGGCDGIICKLMQGLSLLASSNTDTNSDL
jgi:hypothetical protein